MAIKLTTTQEILQVHGVKCLIFGPSGIGKTRLAQTAPRPLIISAESGLLSLRRVNIPVIIVENVADLRDAFRFCLHSEQMQNFDTICLDSITEIAEQILSNAKPRYKDSRLAFGDMLDETMEILKLFRGLNKHVAMMAKMDAIKDELTGIVKYVPMMPGKKLGSQISYIFDEVFRLVYTDEVQSTPYGTFSCKIQTGPDWQADCKDRSGELAQMEPPNLTMIFNKIKNSQEVTNQ